MAQFSLKSALGGSGGIDIGECIYMAEQPQSMITLDNKVYLKSGAVVREEAVNYPEAFDKFSVSIFGGFQACDMSLGVGTLITKYGNGRYVSIVRGGTQVSVSTDAGVTWTSAAPAFFNGARLAFLAFGAGKFLIAYSNSLVASSTDGITWVAVTTGLPTMIAPSSFEFVGSTFILTDGNASIAISTNGTSWTNKGTGTWGVGYAPYYFAPYPGNPNGMYCVLNVNTIYYSTDNAASWSTSTGTLAGATGIASAPAGSAGYGTVVVCSSSGNIYTTTTVGSATSWSSKLLVAGFAFRSVVHVMNSQYFKNGSYVAVGTSYTGGTSTQVYVSADGLTWTQDAGDFAALGAYVTTTNNRMFITSTPSPYQLIDRPAQAIGIPSISDGIETMYTRIK